jgi:hypothetical protein
VNHTGTFTIDSDEHDGASTKLCSPTSACSYVRCECGWDHRPSGLRDAKAELARHQQAMLADERPAV